MSRPMKKEKPKDAKKALRSILKFCRPWYLPLVISLVLSLIATALTLIAPTLMANLTNIIQSGLATGIDIDSVIHAIIIIMIVYMVGGIVSCVASYVMITVMQKLAWTMRNDISRKINRLPLRFFDRNSTGDIMSRITNDVDTITAGLNSSITSLVQGVIQFAGVVILMFVTSAKLAWAAIGSSILGFVLTTVLAVTARKFFRQQQQNMGAMNGHIEEIYSGHNIVRAYGARGEAKKEFERINDNLYNSSWKAQLIGGTMSPIMSFAGSIGYVAVCVLGASLVLKGEILFGTIVAFITYVKLFSSPLSQIAQSVSSLMSAAAAGERVFGFLGEEELSDDSECLDLPEKVAGAVEFDHVRFGYLEDKPVIHDFSAKIKPGQKIAIVGHTGAGKTTMVNLLMRFYELWSGEIRIDGVPVADMKRSAVHSMFGMVLQDTWLFDGTYRENIVYGKENVSDAELRNACKAVGMDHYIMTLPKQYDTVLDDKASLSAGQKQLLTIARAMIENAPMIILDEATSSVDTRTEALVQQAMDKLTEGRTSFVIAHRLSTVRNADMILVMDGGDVVESGSHEELLRSGGLYSELYYSQFEVKA